MGYDFRVESTYRVHPKFILLKQRYGTEAVDAIFALWAFAAEERPKGVLFNMSEIKIAAACGIDPSVIEPSDFVNSLIEIGFLDRREDGVVEIHNWKKRQPNIWSRGEKDPVKVAAGKARWGKNGKQDGKKDIGNQPITGVGADAKQCLGSAEPHPIPSQKESLSQAPDGERARALVFRLMSEIQPKARPKSPDNWPRMLQGLLDDGQTMEDLERSTRFAMQNTFWRSRILSPEGYRDNFCQILDQATKVVVQENQCKEELTGKGMSAETWEELKRQKQSNRECQVNAVNSEPP